MNIGWYDLCLKTSDIDKSRAFYKALGMHVIVDRPNWVALTNGNLTICLMSFLERNLINFRGSDVAAVYDAMTAAGLELDGSPEEYTKEQMGSDGVHWTTFDPDGNAVYFDTTADEANISAHVRKFLDDTERQLEKMGIEAESFEALRDELSARYLSR